MADVELYDGAMEGGEEQSIGISADLIRGHINTIILRSLYDEDKYGYDIINDIEKKSGGQYSLKQPTLYSALKRLESLKYVESYFGDYSNGGRRKYFRLTQKGKEVTEKNLAEWEYSRTIIDSLISDGTSHYDFSFITDKQTELSEMKKTLAARESALEEERLALNALKNELVRERSLLSVQSTTLNAQKTDFNELKEQIGLQKAELAEKERILSEKQGELDAKEQMLAKTQAEISAFRTELLQKEEEIRLLNAKLATQRSELEVALSKQTSLESKISDLESSLEDTEADNFIITQLNANLLQTKTELKTQTDTVADLRSALLAKEQAFELLQREQESKLTEQYSKTLELQSQQARIEDERRVLEEQKAEFKKTIDETKTLRELLEQKEEELRLKESELADIQAKVVSSEKDYSFNTAQLQAKERELLDAQARLAEQKVEYERLKDVLERERASLLTQQNELYAKLEDASKKEFELTQKELEISAKTKSFETRHFEEDEQFQTEMQILRQQQAELAERQELYNRQQLEFIAEKNALASQHFELTDKLQSHSESVRLYEENMQRLESERDSLFEKQRELESLQETLSYREEKLLADEQAFAEQKRIFSEEKASVETLKDERLLKIEEEEKILLARQAELERYHAQLSQRASELQHREDELAIAEKEQPKQSTIPSYPSGYTHKVEEQSINLDDLRVRAAEDGIRIKTAGTMRYEFPQETRKETDSQAEVFNKGFALFKAACLIFSIICVESLAVFFLRGALGVSITYPVVALGVGFVAFIIFAILYAKGYQSTARRQKRATYIGTSMILFVVSVIIVTMVAVYCKADVSVPAILLSYVVIPVVYLLNLVFFAAFYHLFSKQQKR